VQLGGESSGDIPGEKVRIEADRFTPIDATLIPTGEIEPVAGRPLEFRKLTHIGARIDADDQQLKRAGGYDHNFVLNGAAGDLHEAAFAMDPKSGRTMKVLTTQPGVQFYLGNFLSGLNRGCSGRPYAKHAGFCLETQHFPDSPNQPKFPSTVVTPGRLYRSTTVCLEWTWVRESCGQVCSDRLGGSFTLKAHFWRSSSRLRGSGSAACEEIQGFFATLRMTVAGE
jgi:aldose 1-epimerase